MEPAARDSSPRPVRKQLVGSYELGKTIGSGQFGKVKLAVHSATGVKVDQFLSAFVVFGIS
jgi:serine/threonine protein kinase